MIEIEFFYYTTCKCQAPDEWGIFQRRGFARGDFRLTYYQTQSGYGHERILEVFPDGVTAHQPYIAVKNKPLTPILGTSEKEVDQTIQNAIA